MYPSLNQTLCGEHHYQYLIESHYADTKLGYKRDSLLGISSCALETSRSSHFVVYISHPIFTERMSGKVFVVFALLVALLVSGAASPTETGETEETNVLKQLLAKHEMAKDSAGRQRQAPRTHSARVERRAHLSVDEREIMTKQIMQAISELMNSECMTDRDYQGWVDFGRRDTE
ncbi:cholecystokinin isoform X1 [Haplochromis burtoni]|nr:cholecystokinin isoform X1 [Haplochromis burtoni]